MSDSLPVQESPAILRRIKMDPFESDLMGKKPLIRAAQPFDAQAMKKCVEAAYRHYIARMGKPPGPMLDDYAKVIDQHGAAVAEQDGKIVAVLVLINTYSGMLLDNFAVHPAQQGKGLGRRLIQFAESETRNQGYEQLDLYTHQCMTGNIEMYKAMGYKETERKNVRGYDRVYMQRTF